MPSPTPHLPHQASSRLLRDLLPETCSSRTRSSSSGTLKKIVTKRDRDGSDFLTENKREERKKHNFCLQIVTISFDGATKQNGTTNASSSFGVFVLDYNNPYSHGSRCAATTNQAAEISAATAAVQTALEIFNNNNVNQFLLRGDSSHVISAINEARILTYKQHDRFPNSALWIALRTTIDECSSKGIQLLWEWIPRAQNREADQLANCAFSSTAPDTSVRSAFTSALRDADIQQALSVITQRRLPVIKTLPLSLQPLWCSTVFSILRNTQNPTQQRAMFILCPHLLSLNFKGLRNRKDFSSLRDHILLLQQMHYVADCVERLCGKLNEDLDVGLCLNPISSRTKTHTLVQRGLFHKCIADNETSIASFTPTIHNSLTKLFPTSQLPTPIPVLPDCLNLFSFGEVLSAARRLRRGKAVGLSGWSRELLLPILKCTPTPLQETIANIFSTFSNCIGLTDNESLFLRSSILCPLQYISKPGKTRPVTIIDTLIKVAWNAVLYDIIDDTLMNSSNTYGRKGSCQLAIHTVQEALNQGEAVITLDADNAFNTLHRQPAFDYLLRHRRQYKKTFHLVNFFYSNETFATWFRQGGMPSSTYTITTGARQGCVSSMWFYTLGTLDTNTKYRKHIIQVADDIYIFSNALQVADDIIDAFASIGQRLNGPKTRILCTQPIERRLFPSALAFLTKTTTTASKILGGFVTPPTKLRIPDAFLRAAFIPIEAKYERLSHLDASLQDKFLIFKALTFDYLYLAESFLLPQDLRDAFFCQIDAIQKQCFNNLFPGPTLLPNEIETRHVQLFTPLEDGGLNLIPYQHIHSTLLYRSQQRAQPFLNRFAYHIQCGETHNNLESTLKATWVSHMREQHAAMRLHSNNVFRSSFQRIPSLFRSWLEILPTNKILTLSDDEMDFGIQLRLQQLQPRPALCRTDDTILVHLSSTEYTKHILSCRTCGAKNFHNRHEAVNNMLHRTMKHHGLNSDLNPKNLPVPGNLKGGPDCVVGIQGTNYAIDVAITTNDPDVIFQTKLRQYTSFSSLHSFTTFPFVSTIYGTLSHRSVSILKHFWYYPYPNQDFREALLSNFQFALISGIKLGIDKFHAQEHLPSLPTPTPPLPPPPKLTTPFSQNVPTPHTLHPLALSVHNTNVPNTNVPATPGLFSKNKSQQSSPTSHPPH